MVACGERRIDIGSALERLGERNMKIYAHSHNIDHIINDKEFNDNLTNVLNEYVDVVSPEAGDSGNYITTAHDHTIIHRIDIHKHIENWLRNVVNDYCKDSNISIKSIEMHRAWCNRIYRNVKGKPHRHNGVDTQKVVILYYEASKGSSDFVVIDSKEELNSYDMYDKERLYFLPVRPGMAIVHDADILHAVTEHNSDEPRTAFVFDIKIIGRDEHSNA
jgi:hypothetical protein